MRQGQSCLGSSYQARTLCFNPGYTLIEVVVATAIFSAMVLLSSMALNQGLSQYQGLMQRGVNFWDHARHLWVSRSLGSATDYYVKGTTGRWFPYFYGTQDMLSYASLSPLVGDMPVVVWIVKERQDNGKYSLIYYELPLYTKGIKDLDNDYAFGDYKRGTSIRLLSDLDKVEAMFYGYDAIKGVYGWYADYRGNKMLSIPVLVKYTCTSGGKDHVFMFRIHTNSRRKVAYNEDLPVH